MKSNVERDALTASWRAIGEPVGGDSNARFEDCQ